MKTLLLTGADAGFFPLVQGTVLSIREKPQGRALPLAFLDLGCTAGQRAWLDRHVDFVLQLGWEFDFPGQAAAPTYLRGLIARPFFRRYFPDYEVYLWLDADAWVNDWRAIDLLVHGASRRRGLAIVPELDRAYYLPYGKLRWYWQHVHDDYRNCFGPGVADHLHTHPTLNAGVFALHHDAPHWDLWAGCLEKALQRSAGLMSDQVALNVVVYQLGAFPHTELLPAWCNWSCNFGLPVWDRAHDCLAEPYLPHTRIGIVHLTGPKHDWVTLQATDHTTVNTCLRYRSARGANLDDV